MLDTCPYQFPVVSRYLLKKDESFLLFFIWIPKLMLLFKQFLHLYLLFKEFKVYLIGLLRLDEINQ